MRSFTFPVGYHDIHRIKIVNYQLNRWHSLGYCRLEDLIAAASRVILDMNTENLHSSTGDEIFTNIEGSVVLGPRYSLPCWIPINSVHCSVDKNK